MLILHGRRVGFFSVNQIVKVSVYFLIRIHFNKHFRPFMDGKAVYSWQGGVKIWQDTGQLQAH